MVLVSLILPLMFAWTLWQIIEWRRQRLTEIYARRFELYTLSR